MGWLWLALRKTNQLLRLQQPPHQLLKQPPQLLIPLQHQPNLTPPTVLPVHLDDQLTTRTPAQPAVLILAQPAVLTLVQLVARTHITPLVHSLVTCASVNLDNVFITPEVIIVPWSNVFLDWDTVSRTNAEPTDASVTSLCVHVDAASENVPSFA